MNNVQNGYSRDYPTGDNSISACSSSSTQEGSFKSGRGKGGILLSDGGTYDGSNPPSRRGSIHTDISRKSSFSRGFPVLVGTSPTIGGPRVSVTSTPSKSDESETEEEDGFDDGAITGGKKDTFDTVFTPIKQRRKDTGNGLLHKMNTHKSLNARRMSDASPSPVPDWIPQSQSSRQLSNGNSANKSRFILNLEELEGFNKYDEDYVESCS